MDNQLLTSMIVELRRGTLNLVVLNELKKKQYGYSLLQRLEEIGINVEASTLYPMLRRLEKQGVLTSEWDTTEPRPRKYYLLSKTGLDVLHELQIEWNNIVSEMAIIGGENHE